MSLTFDFDGKTFYGSTTGLAYNSTATLVTIPLATAAFSLSAGRACEMHAEWFGIDSSGDLLVGGYFIIVKGGSPPSKPSPYAFSDGRAGAGDLTINGSGDAEITWTNNNVVGRTQDIFVRVSTRYIG